LEVRVRLKFLMSEPWQHCQTEIKQEHHKRQSGSPTSALLSGWLNAHSGRDLEERTTPTTPMRTPKRTLRQKLKRTHQGTQTRLNQGLDFHDYSLRPPQSSSEPCPPPHNGCRGIRTEFRTSEVIPQVGPLTVHDLRIFLQRVI